MNTTEKKKGELNTVTRGNFTVWVENSGSTKYRILSVVNALDGDFHSPATQSMGVQGSGLTGSSRSDSVKNLNLTSTASSSISNPTWTNPNPIPSSFNSSSKTTDERAKQKCEEVTIRVGVPFVAVAHSLARGRRFQVFRIRWHRCITPQSVEVNGTSYYCVAKAQNDVIDAENTPGSQFVAFRKNHCPPEVYVWMLTKDDPDTVYGSFAKGTINGWPLMVEKPKKKHGMSASGAGNPVLATALLTITRIRSASIPKNLMKGGDRGLKRSIDEIRAEGGRVELKDEPILKMRFILVGLGVEMKPGSGIGATHTYGYRKGSTGGTQDKIVIRDGRPVAVASERVSSSSKRKRGTSKGASGVIDLSSDSDSDSIESELTVTDDEDSEIEDDDDQDVNAGATVNDKAETDRPRALDHKASNINEEPPKKKFKPNTSSKAYVLPSRPAGFAPPLPTRIPKIDMSAPTTGGPSANTSKSVTSAGTHVISASQSNPSTSTAASTSTPSAMDTITATLKAATGTSKPHSGDTGTMELARKIDFRVLQVRNRSQSRRISPPREKDSASVDNRNVQTQNQQDKENKRHQTESPGDAVPASLPESAKQVRGHGIQQRALKDRVIGLIETKKKQNKALEKMLEELLGAVDGDNNQ
ncbi:hypothetical protein CVT24_006727 [Panaeolus cyanescens]|uniref:Uncharacterized protein n=1 Tax=Panaeolus cyanescens TaxID=181874 RepID=A0A409V9G8_9AGAR|nr:hypothetical protein CVT24_006727 [Panaeolus cyanescens]